MAVIIPIVIPNGVSAIAAAAAARQRTAECSAWLPGYRHDGATLEQMRYYAECVDWLHPMPADDSRVLWMKAAILAAFIGIAVGVWWTRDDYALETWYGRALFGGFCGAFGGMSVIGASAAMYYGAMYLVT